MLKITIPGQAERSIRQVVFDFNGTLATDGKLARAVKVLLAALREKVDVYILTSDTYGSAQKECDGLGISVHVLHGDSAGGEKEKFVRSLGAEKTICVGNGNNDVKMFAISSLSILIIGAEGCSRQALLNADIIVRNSEDALMLLLNPTRIMATLRA